MSVPRAALRRVALAATVGMIASAGVFPLAAQADRVNATDSVANVPPAPGQVTIDIVTANGSGCKPGTTQVAMSPDNKAMTMTFSEYMAETGPGIKPSQFRKNCQLAVNLNVPQGFSFAVVKADYRGFAQIATGAKGEQRAAYYWQGQATTQRGWTPINGAFEGDYTFTDTADLASVVWSPCGEKRLLNVNTELRINKGSSTEYSMMTTDSADVSVKTEFHLGWKKCP